ncbi:MAG TPA: Fe-S-binding domain-containing protein, partial [Acidobacteria bacterium]|nr:Fe-S-binding domain-containing protein [Acidobacteriota bacterium]
AAYMLWLYQRTMFGTVDNPKNENLPDLNLREWATFIPLLILAVWIGLYPKPFIDRLDTSVSRVMSRVNSADVQLNADTNETQLPARSHDLPVLEGDIVELPVRGGAR